MSSSSSSSSVVAPNLPAAAVVQFVLERDFLSLVTADGRTTLSGCTLSRRKFTTQLLHCPGIIGVSCNQDYHGETPGHGAELHQASLSAIRAIARAATPSGTISMEIALKEGQWHESTFVISTLLGLDPDDHQLSGAMASYNEAAGKGMAEGYSDPIAGKAAMSDFLKTGRGYWALCANGECRQNALMV